MNTIQPLVRRELIHLCGPFSIYSYGLAIIVGLLLFMYLISRHPQFKKLHLQDSFTQAVMIGTLSAIIGGRLLFVLTEEPSYKLSDIVMIWEGGFSILGSISMVVIVLPLYLWYKKIPILECMDLVAMYAPILQATSRIGCFFAGCCHGIPTLQFWGFSYSDVNSAAPLGIPLHPTQIYSAILLLIAFLILYYPGQYYLRYPGERVCLYGVLCSSERFIIDFWRADRTLIIQAHSYTISTYQALAVLMFCISIVCWILLRMRYARSHEYI